MILERKDAQFELTSKTEAGKISGYANVHSIVDNGGDIVEKGAFEGNLEGKTFPMLYGHDHWDMPIGIWTKAYEDERGLYMEGQLTLSMSRGKDAYECVKAGTVTGLSIGYKTLDSEKKGNVRLIKQAELWETSLVTFPMNIESRIDAVKAAEMTERDFERKLTQEAGFSRSVARLLMKGGMPEIRAKQDAGANEGEQVLKSILNAINEKRKETCP